MSLTNGVFKSFLISFVIVFIYDILIYSNSKEQYAKHLHIVVEILGKRKLYVKLSKCKFCLTSIAFLGHLVSEKKVMEDPKSTRKLKWVRSSFVTEVRSFVGLARYCRRFFKSFASVVTLLKRLAYKEVPFVWSYKCDDVFQNLNTFLTTSFII